MVVVIMMVMFMVLCHHCKIFSSINLHCIDMSHFQQLNHSIVHYQNMIVGQIPCLDMLVKIQAVELKLLTHNCTCILLWKKFTREFKLQVSMNGKWQVQTFLAKFSSNVFVSYFLSCIERIITNFSFKTASSFTLYCLIP
jgi:hypothetical protein